MGAKYTIVRIVGEGEQVSAEITIPDKIAGKPTDVHAYLTEHVYKPLDTRLAESSRRILDAMGYAKNLTPEANIAVKRVIDMIYGRAQALPPPDQEALEHDAHAIAEAKREALEAGIDLGEAPVEFKDNVLDFRRNMSEGPQAS